MRLLFFAVFTAAGAACFGQADVAFRVVTCSEGVTIGNQPVAPGMDFSTSKEPLVIPDKGYVAVLTMDGLVYKLTKSMRVSEVDHLVKLELGERKIIVTDGTQDPTGIGFPLAPEYNLAGMTRDSLFIFWGWRQRSRYVLLDKNGKPYKYTVSVTDMYGDQFKEITTDKNWVILDVSPYKKESSIIYTMKGDYDWGKLQEGLIKFGPGSLSDKPREELKYYLNDVDRDFYEFMIYDLNGLRLDVTMTLYRILRDKRKPADPLLQKYFEWLTRKYSLDIVKLD